MLEVVRKQLATDLNCSPDDFLREGFVFAEARENPGRRPYPRKARHLDMLTMGNAVIVSATPDILPYVKEQLAGKTRDEAFEAPFVHGVGINCLPGTLPALSAPDGVSLEIVGRDGIPKLYGLTDKKNFRYALQYDPNHPRPDVLAVTASVDGVVAGIAGVSADCEEMWQIGVDVLPEYRNLGIAAVAVNRLASAVLAKGKVPFYAAAATNIASQRVAGRAGFAPAWATVWRARFDGELTEPTS
jgi:GNAT superfamily N-acetyltransferase